MYVTQISKYEYTRGRLNCPVVVTSTQYCFTTYRRTHCFTLKNPTLFPSEFPRRYFEHQAVKNCASLLCATYQDLTSFFFFD